MRTAGDLESVSFGFAGKLFAPRASQNLKKESYACPEAEAKEVKRVEGKEHETVGLGNPERACIQSKLERGGAPA